MPQKESKAVRRMRESEKDKRTAGAKAGEKSTRDEGKRAKPIGGEKNRPDVGSGGR